MLWKRINAELIARKEWLNSTAFLFQVLILLSLLAYYLFQSFFEKLFYSYSIIMLILSIIAVVLTLIAIVRNTSIKDFSAPGNMVSFAGLFLLLMEAIYHSTGVDVLLFPHNVIFIAGITLLLGGAYYQIKMNEFERKHGGSMMLWITGNVLLLFAVSKHCYESTAFSIRDSVVLLGGAIVSLTGVLQHILLTTYGRELESAMVLGDAKYIAGKFDEAMEHYENGLRVDPKNEYLIVRKGLTLLRMGLNENAFSVFSKAVELHPESIGILMGAGIAASKLGKYRISLEYLKRAEKIKKTPELYNNMGNVLFSIGDIEGAMKAYEKSIELDRNYESAYLNAARVLTRVKQYDKAISMVRRLLEINPESAEAYYQMGKIYMETGDYEKSIETMDIAIMLKPGFSDAWISRGAIMERAKHGISEIGAVPLPHTTRKATLLNLLRLRIFSTLEEYQKIASALTLEQEPTMESRKTLTAILESAHQAFVKKEYAHAMREAKEVLAKEPDNLDALIIFANSAEATGNYSEAYGAYRRVAEICGKPEAYIKAGISAAMGGLWLEAIDMLDTLLENDRENEEAWVLKGLLLYFMDATLPSIECFEYALAFHPENKDALYGKGLALMKLGLDNEAAMCFAQARALSLHFSEIVSILPKTQKTLKDYVRLATEFATQKKFDEATRILNFVMKMKPDDENICYFAAIVYASMKKYAKAEEILRKAVSREPENQDFVLALSEVLRKSGKPGEAVRVLEDCMKTVHENAELYAEYALALKDAGEIEKAGNIIRKAVELEPENERVKHAERRIRVAKE
ncbi:MAG: tetratricopeptide repeat protein [Thermoplasmata archaeon]